MKMTEATWQELKYFKPAEVTDPLLMDQELMFMLDAMRHIIGRSFQIHASHATQGHSPDSAHYQGRAIDGHFDGLSVIEQYILAEQWNWPGLGFYPAWNNPGIHIDTRFVEPYRKGARWWRDKDGIYHSVTMEAIRQFI